MFTVQCDFDDTVTIGDVGTAIVDAFGPKDWESDENAYLSGNLSVEETVRRQYSRIHVSVEDLNKFIAEKATIREGFNAFVDYCQASEISLVIVSSGLDIYIEPILKMFNLQNVEHYTGNGRLERGHVSVEYRGPNGEPVKEGFKMAYFNVLRQRGQPIVYIGDSMSDIKPAKQSQHILARGVLEKQLQAKRIPFMPFEDFNDVVRHMKSLVKQNSLAS